ncbi:hypothetical protein BKA70DRAFT_1241928 [Coprinopsis sp. MPI-PUGE-AT-0042]|nr:hypothetical protein BKA70DRAFT_1241928 [Coprinopsis sp. MPI-PUGE-AT-0042]
MNPLLFYLEYDDNIEGGITQINEILEQDCQAEELGQLFEDLKDNVRKHDGLVWALSARCPEWNLQPFDAKILKDLKHRANVPDDDDLEGAAQDSTRTTIDPLCPVTIALLAKLIVAKERIEKEPGVTQGLEAEAAMDKEARADMSSTASVYGSTQFMAGQLRRQIRKRRYQGQSKALRFFRSETDGSRRLLVNARYMRKQASKLGLRGWIDIELLMKPIAYLYVICSYIVEQG